MDEFEEMMNMAMDSLHMADVSLPKRDLSKPYAIEAPPQVTVPGYEDVAQETAGMTDVQLQDRMYEKAEAEGMYTPPITVAMLKNDPIMAAASRDVYQLFEGKAFEGSDADAVQYGIDVMGEFTFNFAGPVGIELSGGQSSPGGTLKQAAALIGQGDANKAQAFLYVMDQYDRLSVEAEGGFSRMFKGLVADPSNWAAAVTLGGSKILQMGGQTATKQGIKYQIRQLAKTATEKVAKYPAVAAGVGEGLRSGIIEERVIAVEEKAGAEIAPEEKAARIGIASAIGGLTGAGFVKGAEVTGKGLKAGIEETVMPGVRNFVEGAEGRMLAREDGTSVQLNAGVDVPAAVDKAIVGVQKALKKPTKDNPVTAVAPTETEPGIIAFHGSGADFDEFKLEKIGTGIGYQNYGNGLYFSNSIKVAESYKKEPGKVFMVKLGVKEKNLLDWQKPLKEQPVMLKKIRSLIDDDDILQTFDYNVNAGIAAGNAYVNYISGSSQKASELLKSVGIEGIKYLDIGSRAGGKSISDAPTNYVIFNDKAIKILDKYGIVGPVAITGVAASQQGEAETSEAM